MCLKSIWYDIIYWNLKSSGAIYLNHPAKSSQNTVHTFVGSHSFDCHTAEHVHWPWPISLATWQQWRIQLMLTKLDRHEYSINHRLNACVPFFAEDPQIETLQIHQKFIPTIAFQNWLEQRSSSFLKDHDRITTSLLDFNNLIVHICCRACSMDAARQKKPSVCAALRVDGTA